jgi:DnaJ-class molecular chaperone
MNSMTLPSPAPGSDWYSVLGLSPAASADEIAVAVERLSRQASALAVTAPERSRQLREVTRAIKRDLLSGQDIRRRYDQSLRPGGPAAPAAAASGNAPAAPAAGHPGPAAGAPAPPAPDRRKRFVRFLQSAWTCPVCGHDAMPGEEFCTKCGGKLRTATGDNAPAVPSSGGARVPSCAACGVALDPADRFCTHCGSRRQ